MSAVSVRRPTTGPAWEVLHEDATLRIWAIRDLIGVVWFEAPAYEQVQELRRIAKVRGRAFSDGIGLFQVVVRGTPRFTDEVRAEVEKIARDNVFSRGGAHIILVDGLAGSAARAFLSTILLIRRQRAPAKVFGEIAEAAKWFAREVGGPCQASELERMGHALVESGRRPARPQGWG
jgi:hypothetical protein